MQDPEAEFLYFGYRLYNPGMARWLVRDPIQERGSPNIYGMCFNDTSNLIDVLGLAPASSQNFSTITSGPLSYQGNSIEELYEGRHIPQGWDSTENPAFNNCMSYGCNTPGEDPIRLDPKILGNKSITCADVIAALKRSSRIVDPEGDCCPEGYHRIHVRTGVIKDGTGNRDYHVYRQNSDGVWSHFIPEAAYPGGRQPQRFYDDDGIGYMDVTFARPRTTDALDDPIPSDPTAGDHNYAHANYEDDCGIFCAKTGR